MKQLFLITLLLITGFNINAQSKAKIKSQKIKLVTVWESRYKTSNAKEHKESVSKFDQNGNLVDVITYDNTGKFKEHISYKYNKNNKKTNETYYDTKGNVIKIIKYTYNEKNLKTEKKVYDGNNKLKSKKRYIYESRVSD
jgi:hypothetical protein